MSSKVVKDYILKEKILKVGNYDKELISIFKYLGSSFPISVNGSISKRKCIDAEGIVYDVVLNDSRYIVKTLNEIFEFVIHSDKAKLIEHKKFNSNYDIVFSSHMYSGISDIYIMNIYNKHNIVLVITTKDDKFFSVFSKMRLEYESGILYKADDFEELKKFISKIIMKNASCVFIHDGEELVIE